MTPDDSHADARYMARALQLAWRGRFTTHPNPNVGCVIVRDGQIAGEGFHYRAGEPHAEIHALRMAADKARGATVYVTLEPCSHYGRTPPCCEALIAAGVKRVVAAMTDPNPQVAGSGLQRLRQAGISVSHGLMSEVAAQQNVGFLQRMLQGLPWVQLKLAASLDGRTALANGVSQWITSPQARRDVQRLRALSGAILSTSATVLADDPALTVRWQELDAESQALYVAADIRQPVRVVLDRQYRVMPYHRICQQQGVSWLVHGDAGVTPAHAATGWPAGVQQWLIPQHNKQLDLRALLAELARRQINSVWVEAGATLAGALLQADLVDELIVYLAAKVLGDKARGLCVLPAFTSLADAPGFVFADMRRVGPDLCLHLHRAGVTGDGEELPFSFARAKST